MPATKSPKSAAPALEAVCAYCLRTVCLQPGTDAPARHGWTSKYGHGGANGQLGARHSTPCKGMGFPHLGVSTAGLEAAIADAQKWHDRAVAARAELDSFPVLHHGKRDYNRKGAPVVELIPVAKGQVPPYSGPKWHPEYETLHARAVVERDNEVDQSGQYLPILKARLANWAPADPTPAR